ncbi:hypothetical protein [Burkholderia sp. L27(2015)]|uniref:hypothetical protein n=1 Tax=Burkholderia sp. L27(2015) TaxID=1641858 RepID=UPI00131A8D0C|nr:hypothetical protein [Burkholderia sp. L27(2015)]
MMNTISTPKRKRAISFVSLPLIFTSLPFILVAAVWLYFAVLHPIPYWQESGDYPWYALSQAFTLEAKFSGFPATNLGYNIHPGVPFGFAGWVAFRLATQGLSDSSERIAYAMANAQTFWLWAKIIALALNLAGMLALQRIFKGDALRFCIACGLYFAAIPAVFGTSLLQLTNESFALVYITSFYYLTFRLLTDQKNLETEPRPRSSIFTRDLLSFLLGSLTALGCSIKIYYTAPAFGMVIGLIAAVMVKALDKRSALRVFVTFLGGLLFSGTLVINFVIGWPAFKEWIIWNYGMLSHTNRYGSGDQGFMQLSLALDAIKDLTFTTLGTFPLITASLITIYLGTTINGIKDKPWKKKNIPFVVAIFFGIFINLTGLLKHYSPLSQHYALPLCASLSCLLLIKNKDAYGRNFLKIGVILVAALLVVNLHSYTKIHTTNNQLASAVIRDSETIEKLPLLPGEKRVWGYYSPTKAGVMPMINQYAGSSFVSQIINKNSSSNDVTPNDDRDTKNWRYVIFPKSYFPTRESIPQNYPKQFDFAVTKFAIRDTDKISELETFFLLSRVSDVTPGSAK